MDGANRGTSRADAAFTNDLIDLVVKDYSLDLFDYPLPILEAQPESIWAGHLVRSRDSVKLMNALLTIIEGRFDRNPHVHGSLPRKKFIFSRAAATKMTPCSVHSLLRSRNYQTTRSSLSPSAHPQNRQQAAVSSARHTERSKEILPPGSPGFGPGLHSASSTQSHETTGEQVKLLC